MKLQLYRECGPRSTHSAYFEVTEKNALELVTALANEGLRVHFRESDYTEAPGEVVGGAELRYHRRVAAGTVAEVIKVLKPRGR